MASVSGTPIRRDSQSVEIASGGSSAPSSSLVKRMSNAFVSRSDRTKIEPEIALGGNRLKLVVHGSVMGFDSVEEKEQRKEISQEVNSYRRKPKDFEKKVHGYGSSIVGLGKKDGEKSASAEGVPQHHHKEKTQYIERGILRRYHSHAFDDNGPIGFKAVISNQKIDPKVIGPEMLKLLKVGNEMPVIRNVGKKGLSEVKEMVTKEIDGFPGHVLSKQVQKDLTWMGQSEGNSQSEAVKHVVHELIDLYHDAYPEKPMQDIYLLARDAARVIAYQTHFDRGHFSGSSHSIKHILHNIELAKQMMKDIKQEHLSAKDRFLVHLVHIYHDIGYTVPMAQHTSDWFLASADHPLTGAAFIDFNRDYFINLIGEAGFVTLRDSVLLHSHFNANFETKPFNRVERDKLVENGEIHPGIVRSVTSGSDCCAVSSDIKLQEFWMNPKVIVTSGRLQFAFERLANQYADKRVALAKVGGMKDSKLLDRLFELANKKASDHLKKEVYGTPVKVEKGQSVEDALRNRARELSEGGGYFSEEEYFEALKIYHDVREQLHEDAKAISLQVAQAISEDSQEIEQIAALDYKRMKQAIKHNFNFMSIDKAFGQYGAKFLGIQVKSKEDGGQTNYMMISDWSPSRAQRHVQAVNQSAYVAWKKLGEELGLNENHVVDYLTAYMMWKHAAKEEKDEFRAVFDELNIKLNEEGKDAKIKYKEVDGVLMLRGPKGKMVIHTDKEGDDFGIKEAFESILESVKDREIRNQLNAYKVFCGVALSEIESNRVKVEEIAQSLDEQASILLRTIMEKESDEAVVVAELVSKTTDRINKARNPQSGELDKEQFCSNILVHIEEMSSVQFNVDSYIDHGTLA